MKKIFYFIRILLDIIFIPLIYIMPFLVILFVVPLFTLFLIISMVYLSLRFIPSSNNFYDWKETMITLIEEFGSNVSSVVKLLF